jgi:hypothetical protein
VVATATPKGAVVLAADDWPEIDANAFGPAQFERGGAAETLVSAIESTEGDIVLGGLTLFLGEAGIEADARCAAWIVEDGGRPLVVMRTARARITTLIATVAMPSLTDGAIVH